MIEGVTIEQILYGLGILLYAVTTAVMGELVRRTRARSQKVEERLTDTKEYYGMEIVRLDTRLERERQRRRKVKHQTQQQEKMLRELANESDLSQWGSDYVVDSDSDSEDGHCHRLVPRWNDN